MTGIPKEFKPFTGIIKKLREKRISLRNPATKGLLKLIASSELSWATIEKIIHRSKRNIRDAIDFHLEKTKVFDRRLVKIPDAVAAVIKDGYAKSFFTKTRKESRQLAVKMMKEINTILDEEGMKPVNAETMMRYWAPKFNLQWGWPRPDMKRKIEEVIRHYYEESVHLPNMEASIKLRDEMDAAVNALREKNNLAPLESPSISHIATVKMGLYWGYPRKGVSDKNSEAKEPENPVKERNWQEPLVLDVNKSVWSGKGGVRIGLVSRVDYKSAGYRAGLLELAYQRFAEEAVHFICLNGGLVSKKDIKERLKKILQGEPRENWDAIAGHYFDEAAKELAAAIPRLKKPGKENEFVRLYIMTSPVYDGYYGEEIGRRLAALRPDDIRLDNPGGRRMPIKGINKFLWPINPKKNRLPSKFYSTTAEREIIDKEGQTTQGYPDFWVVGTPASAVHKPQGEKKRPYATIPALSRLEEVVTAENQVGVAVLEFLPDDSNLFRVYSFKDIVSNERQYITGIKDGATSLHSRIVDAIKKSGSMTIGLLADTLQVEREKIVESIKFLVEPEMSSRKTWPGLHYNVASQRFDFHLDWIQEKLRYPWQGNFDEDRILFFGCLHAGYTTTDYECFVKELPKIILVRNINVICGLGDFVAGLNHDFMHCGEIIGSANVTEQEKFAAELVGTVLAKVFHERLGGRLTGAVSAESILRVIDDILPYFVYIVGNHDLWQQKHGTTPLVVFREKLIGILRSQIVNALNSRGLPAVDVMPLLSKKIVEVPEYAAIYKMPSGLSAEFFHPHMPSGNTASLRAQKMIEISPEAQIVGGANFHTAIVVHKWQPDIGQRAMAQAGTWVILTMFEHRKLKVVDFGVVYLKVSSRQKRIVATESGFYGKPHLLKPRDKWTNIVELKKSLGLITCE